jgi:tetratricopeptide (TPR) repeat protein
MKYKLMLILLVLSVSVFSQRASDGELYFNSKQYEKAQVVYKDILKKKPTNPLYNYRYARCCYEMKEYEEAIPYFVVSEKKFPLSDLFLGEIYFNSYRFDESVTAYQSYLNTLDQADIRRQELMKKLKKSQNAAWLMTKVEDISIIDSMTVNKNDFLRYYKFSSELGSLSQEIINMPKHQKADKIKYMTQRQDRMYFSDSIQGQMDIFSSFKLLDGWSKPTSISDVINTHANENYPFLLLDGVTVYFASDGENSIGGYDIFVTRFNPAINKFLPPENIGFPFNSTANDYMMAIDEQNKIGWFATDRRQPAGKVMIYTFVPKEIKTIVRTENKDYLRSIAQLTTYRKVSGDKKDNLITLLSKSAESEKRIEFVINDSTVYTNVNQFKNPEAVKLFNELTLLTADYKIKQKELLDLRLKYDRAENDEQRSTITPQIIELEKRNLGMKKQLSLKTVQVRNAEVEFMKGK